MSRVNRHIRGTFISALQGLVPALAVKPHQIAATKHPDRSTKALAKPPPKRRPKRDVDDHLAHKAR